MTRFISIPEDAAVSVSLPNGMAAPVTVDMTASPMFLDDYLALFATKLNETVQGYPIAASAMPNALAGYGNFTSGGAAWLCNESSGNLIPTFGGIAMVPNGSVEYARPGPHGGVDKAVVMDANGDGFEASNTTVLDTDATKDLAIFAVIKTTDVGAGDTYLFSKTDFVGGPGWVFTITSTEQASWAVSEGSGFDSATATTAASAVPINTWCVLGMVLERATNRIRCGVAPLSTGVAVVSAEVNSSLVASVASTHPFRICRSGNVSSEIAVAAVYGAAGVGACTGMSANLSAILTSFANTINAGWSASVDANGRVAIGYGVPSFSLDWTSTTLRDRLGFQYDLNYADTAAELAAQVGFGVWSAGWLLNVASGNDAGAFGGVTLTAVGSPTYGNSGPRGGVDKAIGFDSASDALDGGDNFDVDGTSDLCLMWVGKLTATPSATNMLFVKGNAGAARWTAWFSATTANLNFEVVTASGTRSVAVSALSTVGSWHVGMIVIDRANGTIRAGVCPLGGSPLVSSTAALFAGETMANADSFTVGNRSGAAPALSTLLSAIYVGVGAGAATGMSANLSTALANFAATFSSFTSVKAVDVVDASKYSRMMRALLPPGRLWR